MTRAALSASLLVALCTGCDRPSPSGETAETKTAKTEGEDQQATKPGPAEAPSADADTSPPPTAAAETGDKARGEEGETEAAAEPPAPSTAPYTAPGEVLRKAREGIAYASQRRCEPGAAFPGFTPGPARWVEFRTDWARLEAVVTCDADSFLLRVDIHPHDQPGRRYVLFFVEAGMAVEVREDGGWERTCDGRSCDEGTEALSAAWIAGYEHKTLAPAVSALEDSLEIPKTFEAMSTAPIVDPAAAKGYVVYAADSKLVAHKPDGSSPVELGLAAPERYSRRSRGGAEDRPLVSHDGGTLAYLDGPLLVFVDLDSQAKRPVDTSGAVLIAAWSPGDDALLVQVEDEGPALIDPKTLAVKPVGSSRVSFGASASEFFQATRAPEGEGIVVEVGAAPRFASPTKFLDLPTFDHRPIELDANKLVGVGPDILWVYTRQTKAMAEHPTETNFSTRIDLSPDGKQLAFGGSGEAGPRLFAIELSDTGTFAAEPRDLYPCGSRCNFYWYDAGHVVIADSNAIHVVSLDGESMILAEGVQALRAGRAR